MLSGRFFRMAFVLQLFTFLVFILQSNCFIIVIRNGNFPFLMTMVLFAQLENINKPWNNNRNVHVNERNQNKNKTKLSHVQIDHALILFDLAHKLCNGIIKEWLHCLTSDSKGRFLVIIMLMFGSARCPVML